MQKIIHPLQQTTFTFVVQRENLMAVTYPTTSSLTGIIILAAGSSSRLGQPKQNLIYRGQTLLQRAVETAVSTACETILVVLGGNADTIIPTISNIKVNVIENIDWAGGMSTSIKSGIIEIQKINPAINAVILMLCDQPFVDTHLLNMLILSQTKSGIAACAYNGTIGPPALLNKIYFNQLINLKGNEGAKNLLSKYADILTILPYEPGSIDIDTIEDFNRLS